MLPLCFVHMLLGKPFWSMLPLLNINLSMPKTDDSEWVLTWTCTLRDAHIHNYPQSYSTTLMHECSITLRSMHIHMQTHKHTHTHTDAKGPSKELGERGLEEEQSEDIRHGAEMSKREQGKPCRLCGSWLHWRRGGGEECSTQMYLSKRDLYVN